MRHQRSIAAIALLAALLFAALDAPAQEVQRAAPIIAADVGSRVDALIYKVGSHSRLEFRGTPLAPQALGAARVDAEASRTTVEADFKGLPPAASLGPYTTYVLWAITPEGRASSFGAIDLNSRGAGKLRATTPLNGFAMIVTAEPHFLVTVPSTRVMLRNVAREFEGRVQTVTTLTDRADYSTLTAQVADRKRPQIVDQARYAVAIAKAGGADRLATAAYATAEQALTAAESAWTSKRSRDRRRAPELARLAVQAGEDARIGAARRAEELQQEQAQLAAVEATRASQLAAAAALDQAARAGAAERRAGVAERSGLDLRRELRDRMNAILPTRESARGLVAEVSGVQFATGRATLSPPARESLARLSGVLAAYPNLSLRVEGHTDPTGSDTTNRKLSMDRAIAVRDYLINKGVGAPSIDVDGLGSSVPVSDNATADGRSRNRRVEIIVGGVGMAAN